MKVAVIGSRNFNDYELLKNTLDTLNNIVKISYIVSGGAKGADKLGEKYADENNIEKLIYIPDWNKYGKSAGFRRNVDIIENADSVIAFWNGKSKGTQHSINLTKEKNKKLKIVYF
jgi:hypothetical protein